MSLHSRFLLLACPRAAILAAGLVEFPCEIETERAAGRVTDGNLAQAVDYGIGLIRVEDVVATQVGGEGTQGAQVEVALNAKAGVEAVSNDAEVIVVAVRSPLCRGFQAEVLRQLEVVLPNEREIRLVEREHGANSRALLAYPLPFGGRCLVVLEDEEGVPHGMPFPLRIEN